MGGLEALQRLPTCHLEESKQKSQRGAWRLLLSPCPPRMPGHLSDPPVVAEGGDEQGQPLTLKPHRASKVMLKVLGPEGLQWQMQDEANLWWQLVAM